MSSTISSRRCALRRGTEGAAMRLELDSRPVFAATGGRANEPGRPLVVFLHGAGMDHSVWALQSRWFAHHGHRVLAVDLPGHGGSAGPALTEIGALAEWTARLIGAVGAERAALVGHSMGALIGLETAARHPALVARMALIGVAGKMPVHPELLAAAKANSHAAVDMVSLWSLGAPATLGGSRLRACGCWAGRSACWKRRRRASSMRISPPATPIRAPQRPRRRSPARRP